jgi:hypothetical protein
MPLVTEEKDVQVALDQATRVFDLAGRFSTEDVVRPHLLSSLLGYGRETFRAIMQRPPEWLRISKKLKSTAMFQEAMVHIVGDLRRWRFATIDNPAFPPEVAMLIKKKAAELKSLKIEIDTRLFTSTICFDKRNVVLNHADDSTGNTWFVVQYWRDWLSRSLATAVFSKASCIDGNMYRDMATAGDAYLPASTHVAALTCWKGKDFSLSDLIELGEDLHIMKEFAQQMSQPLCINHSMLSVEEEKIPYFTCIKVEKDEFPW